jgi:RNA-binding protein PNO1
MVVAHSQPSTSTSPRKNRRRVSRKPPPTDVDMHNAHVDSSSKPTNDDKVMIDTDPIALSLPTSAPQFSELPASAQSSTLKSEIRRIPIPPHRMTPLKKDWINIFGPLTEILGLQVRMNVQRKCVEARVCARRMYIGHLLMTSSP